jgi:hypothetical protein
MSDDQTNLTLRQRRRLQQSDSDAEPQSKPTSKRRYLWALLSVGLVALAGVGVWAWIHFHPGTDPRLQEFVALQAQADKLANPMGPEALAIYKQMREKAKDLPDDLKGKVREMGQHSFKSRSEQFFAKSSKDQLAELDQFIFMIQANELKNSLTGQSSANAGGGSGKPGGPGGRTDAQKVQWWQGRMATISPQQRAQFGLGIQMLNARMQQQGVTPPAGGFF